MPSFVFASEPPEPSPDVDNCVEACPDNQEPIKRYKIEVTVVTRAGDIPLQGLAVSVDNGSLGNTDTDGKSPQTPPRTQDTALIEVHYINVAERLKNETFTLSITGISADSKSYTLGNGKNFISKVQDVFGSGADSMGGDLDFSDEYAYPASLASMEDTDDPDIVLLKVDVKMATFSLQVPYLSQIGNSEIIVVQAATEASPTPVTHSYIGSIICMPTATKMLLDYWDITMSDGGELSRNALMQRCWDENDNPSVGYPTPWQGWDDLRVVTGKLLNESDLNIYSVSNGPSSNSGSIPSSYANNILGEIKQGRPLVVSTYATKGHVMVIRGAIVDHNESVQWLIFNDPYGNLAGQDSIYDNLDISAPVGLRGSSIVTVINQGNDVLGAREALHHLGHYNGSMTEVVDEADPDDATVLAIKTLQGGANPDGRIDPSGRTEAKINQQLNSGTKPSYTNKENEKNTTSGDSATRGKHVYYSSSTEARGVGNNHHFRLKGQTFTLIIEKTIALSSTEIKQKLTPNG